MCSTKRVSHIVAGSLSYATRHNFRPGSARKRATVRLAREPVPATSIIRAIPRDAPTSYMGVTRAPRLGVDSQLRWYHYPPLDRCRLSNHLLVLPKRTNGTPTLSLRSLPAVLLVTVALLGAPAAATAVTISSLQSHSASASAEGEVSPAVLTWAATGLIGLGAMITFGATVVRRKETQPVAPVLELVREPAAPSYA